MTIWKKELDKEHQLDKKANIIRDINEAKSKLDEIYDEKVKRMMIRSRAKWIEKGEKPTRYFLKLESRHFLNKAFIELEKNDGTIVSEAEEILSETKAFYEKLYTQQDLTCTSLDEYFKDVKISKLSDKECSTIEGDLTKTENSLELKNMKNDKSPGPDGFTTEFYNFFWKDVGDFLLKSLNFGYKKGKLSITQTQGLITCIPKGNKPKKNLKNWRPISLLNTSYKIGASAIANRFQ